MTPIEKLHTFARRFCIEREAELWREYKQAKQQNMYREEEHGTPRRAAIGAILVEVERLTQDDFRSRQHAALRLKELGQMAQSHLTEQKVWQKPLYQQAMQAERDRFVEAIGTFATQSDWKHWNVEPLPFRRTLREEESAELMKRLRERWGITQRWWIPFNRYEVSYEALVLDSTAVNDLLTTGTLREIFAQRGIQRLYELWESLREPDREIELSLWEPYQGFWTEKYWLTNEMDWLFYTTHENSTTIAGDGLLAEIKAAWPEWETHRWVAPWRKPTLSE